MGATPPVRQAFKWSTEANHIASPPETIKRRVETQPQKPPPTHQRPPVENKTLNLIPEQKALNRTSEKSPNPTTATSHTEGGGEPLEETTDDPRAA
ncbi:hypothetical protein DY000_02019164 [Brassica cretica]|uniref:Uncharacterized protein n=1 Tax=Brassica cretica TaxID=69181 RepID=A0ABQ7D157_BRACR|nr:hypothetical protein DY000_02019164 [Brassica cretica]